MHATVHV